MKRTISKVIDLIKQKKESAEQERKKAYNSNMPFVEKYAEVNKFIGYDEAYTDILALLESSHLVEQEKAIDMLKEHSVVCQQFDNFYLVSNVVQISKEEYDLLSEVLKNEE